MSWILNPEGDRPAQRRPVKKDESAESPDGIASPWQATPVEDDEPKVPDPSIPNRMVSTKRANRPFLAYSEYRNKMEKEHNDWVERQKVRAEKLARGEEVGPEEPDPTAEPEVGCLGLLKFLVCVVIVLALAGKFFAGSFSWEQQLPKLRQSISPDQRLFSEKGLVGYDGSIEGRPIYLAIDGDVYDVTEGRATYGPGGSYHMMAGKDAARAFATGCFATHLTADLRGLDASEHHSLNHWKKFYASSTKYRKVGRVLHLPIDPMSPIPEHCDPKKGGPQKGSEKSQGHEEL